MTVWMMKQLIRIYFQLFFYASGCSSKTYDFEEFINLNREEKHAIIKEVG